MRTSVILVDHGSRRSQSNRMLEKVVELVRETTGWEIVEAAHMEIAEPSIGAAVDRCVARGAELVVVQPFVLLPGRHWRDDIPRLVAEAAARHPGVRWLVTAPLGDHPLMARIVADRIDGCLACARGEAPPCEVCGDPDRCRLRGCTMEPEDGP